MSIVCPRVPCPQDILQVFAGPCFEFVPVVPGQMGTRCVNSLSPCPQDILQVFAGPCFEFVPVVPGQMGTRCVNSLFPCPVSPRHITSVRWPVLSLSLLSQDRWGQMGTRCVQ